eukprot:9166408-Lingulodinium_polyedra.AAC.1
MSPLRTRPMSEVRDCLAADASGMPDAELREVRQFSQRLWQGWGQSKIVEDGNKLARGVETEDTDTKAMASMKLWDVLRSKEVMASHRRQEIDPDQASQPLPVAPRPPSKALFHYQGIQPSVNLLGITERRTWPSFTAQSSKGLHAHRHLLQHCLAKDCWALASRCWLSAFLEKGGVVLHKESGNYHLVLGNVEG